MPCNTIKMDNGASINMTQCKLTKSNSCSFKKEKILEFKGCMHHLVREQQGNLINFQEHPQEQTRTCRVLTSNVTSEPITFKKKFLYLGNLIIRVNPLSSHPFPFSPVLEKGIVGYSTRQTDKTTRGRDKLLHGKTGD
jgi:hypothetical protein